MRKTFSLPVAATAAGGGPTPPPADTVDNIEHSVRFNSADSAYLSRTPSSAGNRKTWTWSGWVKRSALDTSQTLFMSEISFTNYASLFFNSSNQLASYLDGITGGAITNATDAVFRDCSAWMHVVWAVDSTQSTPADRVKLYVNGVLQSTTGSSITGDDVFPINSTFDQVIGIRTYNSTSGLDAYLSNIVHVDGQALTPSSFGFTDSNGVWQPKAYTGSYGTNGFHLDFADTSSATALGNDVSGNNNDWTPSGLVAGPAYTANSFSTEFDGTGDYLSIPDSTDLDLGSGDFTIETWIYSDSANTLGTIIGKRTSYGQYSAFILRNTSTTGLQLLMSNTAGNAFTVNQTASSVITSNTWHHIAVTRNGSAIKAYVDGTEVISSTFSTAVYQNTEPVVIGSAVDNHHWNGKISNLRIIKGRALYTAAFTPPSTALTATDDTVLLTCQDATVRDNSNIGHSVTASGDVAVVNEGPFNGYSGSFDGTGDYIDNTSNYLISSTTSTFTVESWIYMTANPTNDTNNIPGLITVNSGGGASTINYMAFGPISTRKLRVRWYDGASKHAEGSTTLALNTWYHVACSVNNNSIKFFVNGVEETLTGTTTLTNRSGDGNGFAIGQSYTYANYAGRVSNLRVTSGQALYTAAFTPPTADLTTTSQGATASNVKLLTCQDSTFIDNSPSAHTITATNATTISVNPHTDKYSVTFDGNGDYLTIPQSSDWLYTGDYTIEFWLYQLTNADWCAYATGGGGSNDQFVNINNTVYWSFGTTNAVTGSFGAGDVNQWIHWAVTRSGNVTRMFKNGVVVDTATSTPVNIGRSNADLYLGVRTDLAYYVNGKISNLRVTNGQALYTSNFLPSKEDLTTTSQGATASNVKLLTCQSYKIQDNSDSPLTITANGDAKPSTDAPFVTSGAGSFDGTGDYLSVPNSSDFAFGTGDFTVEMWVYYTGTFGGLVAADQTGAGYWASLISSDTLYWQSQNGSTNLFSTSYTNYEGKWTHVAFVRNSGTTSVYLNGTYITGAADSTNYNATGGNIDIGRDLDNVSYLTGKLSNVRISKGLARYTSNFTPPTEDFDPTDQDTTFLALQGNTLDDLAGDHAVSALGNAATSTVSPFEPVDGSDAMLDSPTNYGSGDTVRGNYCTWNPLQKNANASLSNGNLDYLATGGYPNGAVGTMAVSSGKWYFETVCTANFYTPPVYYAAVVNTETFSLPSSGYIGGSTGLYAYSLREGGTYTDGSWTASGWSTGAVNDVIGVALDLDAGTVTFYKNNTLLGTLSGLSGSFAPLTASDTAASGGAGFTNFGQQPFKYPAPTGYKSLCSTNLPTGTVTTSGSFTGTGTADGPFIYLNGVPTAMTINSNSVTFGTDADKLSNGFKVRSSSASYNSTGTNTYSITTTGDTFNRSRAQTNP